MMVPPICASAYLERVSPDGPERQRQFNLFGDKARLGRGHSNDFTLPLLAISKYHTEFRRLGDHWAIIDLSENGTLVNHRRIRSREFVRLADNDIISFLHNRTADYRYVNLLWGSESIFQVNPTPTMNEVMPPPIMTRPSATAQGTSQAKSKTENAAGLTESRVSAQARGQKSNQCAHSSPPFDDDGPSSVQSADTVILPGWTGSPASYLPRTPAYSPGSPSMAHSLYSPRATHISRRLQELTILEAKAQLRTERDNLQRQLQSAKQQAERRFEVRLMDIMEEDLSCTVCKDILIEPVVVECGHVFCSHCITVWIEQQRIQSVNKPPCPLCNADIEFPRKVFSYGGFSERIYSLLSTETQKSRKQILQQREAEHKHWEAEQVALRAEQERWFQLTMYETGEEAIHAIQNAVAAQHHAPVPARNNSRRIQSGHQLAPQVVNRFPDWDQEPANQLNVSGRWEAVRVERLTQESQLQTRSLHFTRRGRPLVQYRAVNTEKRVDSSDHSGQKLTERMTKARRIPRAQSSPSLSRQLRRRRRQRFQRLEQERLAREEETLHNQTQARAQAEVGQNAMQPHGDFEEIRLQHYGAQGDVTTQNRSIDPVYGYFTSNPQAPQLAPEAAREGHHQGLEPTNHPNVSWQQQRIQVISFTQESPRGARFHNNGRPFRPWTQGHGSQVQPYPPPAVIRHESPHDRRQSFLGRGRWGNRREF